MTFHSHVLETKDYLEKSKDKRVEVMRLLTEPKELADIEYYKKMWNALQRETKKISEPYDNLWVYGFLDAVIVAKSLPPASSSLVSSR